MACGWYTQPCLVSLQPYTYPETERENRPVRPSANCLHTCLPKSGSFTYTLRRKISHIFCPFQDSRNMYCTAPCGSLCPMVSYSSALIKLKEHTKQETVLTDAVWYFLLVKVFQHFCRHKKSWSGSGFSTSLVPDPDTVNPETLMMYIHKEHQHAHC